MTLNEYIELVRKLKAGTEEKSEPVYDTGEYIIIDYTPKPTKFIPSEIARNENEIKVHAERFGYKITNYISNDIWVDKKGNRYSIDKNPIDWNKIIKSPS